ncbi:hypothetical protein XELAEV_18005842mg [Xenopus laevis]|uniref:Albumin domain-containing protein n=1 Tax=Xenopus laevis TaxID=8355 RepID=A0A974DY52_XENLA|nr:hypothetical protein XELAEV_18005842mg [Xenopus laevis]
MNSRKYSNASFEEIGHLVTAIVSLAETCCAKEAAADCYDKKGIGIVLANLCRLGNLPLERKLCLADVKQPPKEFLTLNHPMKSCVNLSKKKLVFSARFLYDYASNYTQAPFLAVVNFIEKYLNMIRECCTKPRQTLCFLKQRLQLKPLHLLTVMSNRLCGRYNIYGEEKFTFE